MNEVERRGLEERSQGRGPCAAENTKKLSSTAQCDLLESTTSDEKGRGGGGEGAGPVAPDHRACLPASARLSVLL